MLQSSWRGKNLINKLDTSGSKYVILSGPHSFLNFPIDAEQNSIYKVCINLKKESGNGILYCNIYGNKNFDFPQIKILCDNYDWSVCEFYLETKSFPKTLPLTFRLWRGPQSSGSIAIKTIVFDKEEEVKHNNVIFLSSVKPIVDKNTIIEINPEQKDVDVFNQKEIENIQKEKDECVVKNTIQGISCDIENTIIKEENISNQLDEKQVKKSGGNILSLIKDNIFFSGTPLVLEKENEENIYLFTPYYKEDGYERQDEIHLCLEKNIENKYITKIILFSEIEEIPQKYMCDKVKVVFLPEWTTYNKVIKYINEKEEFLNSYNIILNSDMYIDESISLIKKINIDNSCIAISPWSVDKKIIINEVASQGCWIFKNKIKEFDYIIPMGRPGCEHRLLYELHKKGYILYNLCYDIFVWHKHFSDDRKYNSKDRVAKPYIMLWSNKHKKK